MAIYRSAVFEREDGEVLRGYLLIDVRVVTVEHLVERHGVRNRLCVVAQYSLPALVALHGVPAQHRAMVVTDQMELGPAKMVGQRKDVLPDLVVVILGDVVWPGPG